MNTDYFRNNQLSDYLHSLDKQEAESRKCTQCGETFHKSETTSIGNKDYCTTCFDSHLSESM